MSRRDIYYWKCDRPAAFHCTQTRGEADAQIEAQLHMALQGHFNVHAIKLKPAPSQGNHLTWHARIADREMFIRVESGPEGDSHLAVESALMEKVSITGVPTPCVFGCDASRSSVPFAWQALEYIPAPDLNQHFKQGVMDVPRIAFEIGASVAKWQMVALEGFGTLDENLHGYHRAYTDYFHLRLDQHLHFLSKRDFLANAAEIRAEIENHRALLDIASGCLVHKDLALWNILGTRDHVAAFIDFDDAISGDAMDDLSLLACFHDEIFLRRAFDGYQSIRPLPGEHLRRFWLHLLRNMIVKAVIRVGAGYFDRDDGFFLIGSGSSGAALREMTLARLATALRGLRECAGLDILST